MKYIDIYRKYPKSEFQRVANEYFIGQLLSKNDVGDAKTIEVTAMNMENDMGTDMIPSAIYTFKYSSTVVEELGQYKFYDTMPLILCTFNMNGKVGGINFNLVPNDARASILDIIHSTNKAFYEKGVYNGEKINKPLASALISGETRNAVIRRFSDITKLDIMKACRVYKKSNIVNMRFIEYDMWKYIPFLTFTESIRGASLANLQKELFIPDK